jgi:hypothetical protein
LERAKKVSPQIQDLRLFERRGGRMVNGGGWYEIFKQATIEQFHATRYGVNFFDD